MNKFNSKTEEVQQQQADSLESQNSCLRACWWKTRKTPQHKRLEGDFFFFFRCRKIINFPPLQHSEQAILPKVLIECIDFGKESLFLHFTYWQSCKVTMINTTSQYRWNPANNAFLTKAKRYFSISTSPVTANQTSNPSWWKRLPTWLRGKHGSKLEDKAKSSKSRKETRLKQDSIPLSVSIPIESLKYIFLLKCNMPIERYINYTSTARWILWDQIKPPWPHTDLTPRNPPSCLILVTGSPPRPTTVLVPTIVSHFYLPLNFKQSHTQCTLLCLASCSALC